MSEKRVLYPDPFPWLDYRRYSFSMGIEKGGVLFTSGQSASQYDPDQGRVVCRGGVVEQMRLVYEKLGRVLEAAGASYENVVKTVDYITPQALDEYPGTAQVRRECFDGSWPAATGIVVDRLLRPDGLIEVETLAVLNTKKESIDPGWSRYQHLTYAPAVRAGDLLCISGFTGYRADPGSDWTSRPYGSRQTSAAYETIASLLSEARATPRDVVKSLDYITPACVGTYLSSEKVRERFYQSAQPATSGVVMDRLLRAETMIEVETTAVMDGERQEITPPGWSSHHGGLSGPAAIKKGRFLFLAGQTALNHHTGAIVGAGDVLAQTRQVYSNIQTVLEASGGTMDDVVKTIEFVTPPGLDSYRRVAEIRKEFFPKDYPAATGVVVNSLVRPGLLIQVEAVAILD